MDDPGKGGLTARRDFIAWISHFIHCFIHTLSPILGAFEQVDNAHFNLRPFHPIYFHPRDAIIHISTTLLQQQQNNVYITLNSSK